MKGWNYESKRHSLARQGVKTGRKIKEEVVSRTIEPKTNDYYTKDKAFGEELKSLQASIEALQKKLIDAGYRADDVESHAYLTVSEHKFVDERVQRHITLRLMSEDEDDVIEIEVMQTPQKSLVYKSDYVFDNWHGSFLELKGGKIEEHGIYFPGNKTKLINSFKKYINEYAQMNDIKDFKLETE